MSAPAITYGAFALTYGVGVVLEHLPTRCSVYFCPGDDSAEFIERLERAMDAAPGLPIATILARLWEDYRP